MGCSQRASSTLVQFGENNPAGVSYWRGRGGRDGRDRQDDQAISDEDVDLDRLADELEAKNDFRQAVYVLVERLGQLAGRTAEKEVSPESAAAMEYFETNFSTSDWYDLVGDVSVTNGTVEIQTIMPSDGTAWRDRAIEICEAVSGYVYSAVDGEGLSAIRVLADDGTVRASRSSESESC